MVKNGGEKHWQISLCPGLLAEQTLTKVHSAVYGLYFPHFPHDVKLSVKYIATFMGIFPSARSHFLAYVKLLLKYIGVYF